MKRVSSIFFTIVIAFGSVLISQAMKKTTEGNLVYLLGEPLARTGGVSLQQQLHEDDKELTDSKANKEAAAKIAAAHANQKASKSQAADVSLQAGRQLNLARGLALAGCNRIQGNALQAGSVSRSPLQQFLDKQFAPFNKYKSVLPDDAWQIIIKASGIADFFSKFKPTCLFSCKLKRDAELTCFDYCPVQSPTCTQDGQFFFIDEEAASRVYSIDKLGVTHCLRPPVRTCEDPNNELPVKAFTVFKSVVASPTADILAVVAQEDKLLVDIDSGQKEYLRDADEAPVNYRIEFLCSRSKRTLGQIAFDSIPLRIDWNLQGTLLAVHKDSHCIEIMKMTRDKDEVTHELVTTIDTNAEINPWCPLAWSKDGKSLAIGFKYDQAQLFNLETGKSISIGQGPVTDIKWSPDGRYIAIGSGMAGICLWDAVASKIHGLLEAQDTCVANLAWSKDGKYLVAALNEGSVKIFDVESGLSNNNRVIQGSGERCDDCKVKFSPCGKFFAVSGKVLRIVDIATAHTVCSINKYGHNFSWSSDGSKIAFFESLKRVMYLYDVSFLHEDTFFKQLDGALTEDQLGLLMLLKDFKAENDESDAMELREIAQSSNIAGMTAQALCSTLNSFHNLMRQLIVKKYKISGFVKAANNEYCVGPDAFCQILKAQCTQFMNEPVKNPRNHDAIIGLTQFIYDECEGDTIAFEKHLNSVLDHIEKIMETSGWNRTFDEQARRKKNLLRAAITIGISNASGN